MPKGPRPERSSAETLIYVARSYEIAARQLNRNDAEFDDIASAFYLLGSYALELSFKAIYKKIGNATEDDLYKISHDLKSAYHKAIDCRIHERLWTADVAIMVENLHYHHVTNNFRYLPKGDNLLQVPHPDMLLRTLDALLKEVEAIVFEDV